MQMFAKKRIEILIERALLKRLPRNSSARA